MNKQLITLNHFDFVRVAGPDARKFLQGQLSCNLDLLSPQRSLRGALCNLKGRVIADVRVLLWQEDCLLQTARGMAPVVLATLGKYAVFSKVTLTRQTPGLPVIGLLGTDAATALGELCPPLPAAIDGVSQAGTASIIRLAGAAPRYELWLQDEAALAALPPAVTALLTDDDTAWRREDVRTGTVHVEAATTEEYTPQLLNYDISGVVDFKKGCYTGQEVVARMFYRGVAKKRLFLASTNIALAAGDTVHAVGDDAEKDFPILAYSNAGDGENSTLLLAVLGTDVAESGQTLGITGKPEASVTLLPLSYASGTEQ